VLRGTGLKAFVRLYEGTAGSWLVPTLFKQSGITQVAATCERLVLVCLASRACSGPI
jgi:hypothetical protein